MARDRTRFQPNIDLAGELTRWNSLFTTHPGIRRVDPTHRWRGGRVAEGGGLLMRGPAFPYIPPHTVM
jgi:hypothetical protein